MKDYIKTVMGISTQILQHPSLEQDIEVKIQSLTLIPNKADAPDYQGLLFL